MFQLDDNLLQELGLGALPPVEKNKMLAHIYETLELRVGMRLADQMSDSQLDEFERFIDGDLAYAKSYLDTNAPGWPQDQTYLAQVADAQKEGRSADSVTPEFAALRWLEKNFPQYKQVVAEELSKLKSEIKQQAPAILQATLADSQGPSAAGDPGSIDASQTPPPAT